MANSINRAIIVGRVGKDPEIKSFSNGGKIANFSIATTETWKDRQSGERRESTEWHNVTIQSEGLVGIVEQYVKKGDLIGIEGSIKTRKWQDQSGNDRYSTEIVVTAFGGQLHILGSKKDSDRETSTSTRSQSQSSGNGGGGYGGNGDYDSEIPF